jgi:hypothetical protein
MLSCVQEPNNTWALMALGHVTFFSHVGHRYECVHVTGFTAHHVIMCVLSTACMIPVTFAYIPGLNLLFR